jgi:hypothetical protein
MKEIRLRDLVDLMVAEVPDAEKRIEKMFQWHHDRVMAISQWMLGAAASLFAVLLVAFFRGDLELAFWKIGLLVLGISIVAILGFLRIWQLRVMNHQFVATLKLYSEFKKINHFFVLYREERKQKEVTSED